MPERIRSASIACYRVNRRRRLTRNIACRAMRINTLRRRSASKADAGLHARIQLTGQEKWNRSVAWSIGGPLALRRVFLAAGIASQGQSAVGSGSP